MAFVELVNQVISMTATGNSGQRRYMQKPDGSGPVATLPLFGEPWGIDDPVESGLFATGRQRTYAGNRPDIIIWDYTYTDVYPIDENTPFAFLPRNRVPTAQSQRLDDPYMIIQGTVYTYSDDGNIARGSIPIRYNAVSQTLPKIYTDPYQMVHDIGLVLNTVNAESFEGGFPGQVLCTEAPLQEFRNWNGEQRWRVDYRFETIIRPASAQNPSLPEERASDMSGGWNHFWDPYNGYYREIVPHPYPSEDFRTVIGWA